MTLPVNLLMWCCATLPIVILLVLMVKLQWGAAEAAPVGLLVAFISSLILYKAPINLVALESAKGIWSAISVLLVIFPAILIYEVTSEAKGFDVFRRGMQKFTPNELLQVIAVGWVFVSFLQGITGFGVPVAVGAPLLVGIGVSPMYAVIIPLVGHAWGNTFGTLGVAWNSLVQTTGLVEGSAEFLATALWAGVFVWIFNFTTGVLVCWLYGGMPALKKGFIALTTISLIQGGGQLLLSQINPIIAAFIPATIALVAVMLLGKTKWYRSPWKLENSPCIDRSRTLDDDVIEENPLTLNQAFLPYYILTAITFIGLVIKPVNALLSQWKIGFLFPQTVTGYGIINPEVALYAPISPLTHPGMFLTLSAVVGFFFFRKKGKILNGAGKDILIRTIEKTIPSSIAVISLLIMSKIMAGTGQTEVLAQGTAMVTGQFYAIIAPFIGVLGSFMTSSNMASNILFGSFQQTTASLLGLNVEAILGAQTAGGAIGNTICPGNVVLATTTAGILGKEGLVLRRTIPIAVGVSIFIGLILMASIYIL